jgi:hypothetical protein
MEADFCVAALEEALARYGKPEIFNNPDKRFFRLWFRDDSGVEG